MLNQVGLFDLWNYRDVKSNADWIFALVDSRSMPRSESGEPRWTPAQVAKFKKWIDDGLQP